MSSGLIGCLECASKSQFTETEPALAGGWKVIDGGFRCPSCQAKLDRLKFYYFGCYTNERGESQSGHYLYDSKRGWMTCSDLPLKPFNGDKGYYELDGGFAFIDKERYEPEGVAAVHVFDECTVLAFWDRSADRRHKSNSAFIVEGKKNFGEIVRMARERFPNIFGRFKFEITLGAYTDHRIPKP